MKFYSLLSLVAIILLFSQHDKLLELLSMNRSHIISHLYFCSLLKFSIRFVWYALYQRLFIFCQILTFVINNLRQSNNLWMFSAFVHSWAFNELFQTHLAAPCPTMICFKEFKDSLKQEKPWQKKILKCDLWLKGHNHCQVWKLSIFFLFFKMEDAANKENMHEMSFNSRGKSTTVFTCSE